MKKRYVYAVIFNKDRMVNFSKVQLCQKTGEQDSFKYQGREFDIDSMNFAMYKGFPLYFYNYNNTKPLDPTTAKAGLYKPEDYRSGLESQILSKLIDVLQGGNINFKDFIIIGVAIGLLLVIGLMIYFYVDIKGALPVITTALALWG